MKIPKETKKNTLLVLSHIVYRNSTDEKNTIITLKEDNIKEKI